MKNKFVIFIFCFLNLSNLVFAEDILFETKNIEILENKNLIIAKKGKAVTLDKEIEIYADTFEYSKDQNTLKSFGNGLALLKNENIEIKFDSSVYNIKNKSINIDGNIEIKNIKNKILIFANQVKYMENKKIISSDSEIIIKDELENSYSADKFFYDLNKKIIKVSNLNMRDQNGNNLNSPLAYINTDSGNIFGKDINLNLDNSSFNNENQPRLKGNSFKNNEFVTQIKKGVFTTCKKRDGCPPWQISAEEVSHNKKERTINYKNALLTVYDVPIFYFPRFFHPDPTVNRKSGFLIPTFQSSNSDNYLKVPYFFAIAENKDLTFKPRFYNSEKILLQNEYRQINAKSNHKADIGIFLEEKQNSKNHLFYDYTKSFDLKSFKNNKYFFKLQRTSNDTYLRKNKIKTEIILDDNVLENSTGFSLKSNDFSLDLKTTVYEDLNKNDHDRFDYILPKIDMLKKIDNKTRLNGDFSFKSQALIRNYDTNVYEKRNINDLIFNSNSLITEKGFFNNYKFIVKNTNIDSENSTEFENKTNHYLSGIFQYNSSYPLIKKNKKYEEIFKPKISLNLSPNYTRDISNKNFRIDANNVYSLTRTTDNNFVEGGTSIIYGADYSLINSEKTREVLNLKLANNFRFKENEDLPGDNQIGEQFSNIFGEISYTPSEIFNINYNTSIKNSFSELSYEKLTTEIKINNFVTKFDYLNENISNDKSSYLYNKTSYLLDNSNELSFSTRENKTTNLTEYYNLMYQYKNDCLAASVEYNKDYYDDRDLKPVESVFFKLTIIPFGEASSPNLRN